MQYIFKFINVCVLEHPFKQKSSYLKSFTA